MRCISRFRLSLFALLLCTFFIPSKATSAASRHHVISFGKWSTVSWSVDSGAKARDDKPPTLKVRPLLVDSQVKEFTLGIAHDVTDRLFVVQRAFRLNDSLPQESTSPPHWQWQRGGWLLVDRISGHISAVSLTEFDSLYSEASWFRDYVAYCGVSDDGKKLSAIVAQIGRRKPVLRKLLDGNSGAKGEEVGVNSICPPPTWQRNPSRVSFEPGGFPKQTFAIRGRAVDLVTEENDEEEASK